MDSDLGPGVRRLAEQSLWTTACTAAEVTPAGFRALRDQGLYLVRLDLAGVAGNPVTVRELVVAVQVLRRLGILVEYGVDLFAGTPRFAGVRAKVAMLREIVADGTTPAGFAVGALEEDCSPWLAAYRDRLASAAGPWLRTGGLSRRLAAAWTELVVTERLLPAMRGVAAHRIALQRLTLRSNTELLNLVSASAREYEASGATQLLDDELIAPRAALLAESMLALRNHFRETNAPALLAAGATC